MSLELIVEDTPDPEHIQELVAGLVAFNRSRAENPQHRLIGVFLRDGDRILGGANGYTHWHWLFINHVWIDEGLRGRGTGRAVMAAIEDGGRGRGCRAAWLDTFSFQALGFYQALGYRQFGELADYPPGQTRHFLWKPLH
jgi:GNAT superfamily N-acetyltransferase